MNKKVENIIWAGILFVQIFLFYWASSQEDIIIYYESFFEWQKNFHIRLFSWSRFSFGDIIYFGILLMFFICFFKERKIQWKIFWVGFNVFYFVYQIFWGLLYFQKPLKDKFIFNNFNKKEVEHLTLKYLHNCKNIRDKVSEDEKGVFKIQDTKNIEEDILVNQNKLPEKFKRNIIKENSIKPSVFSFMMNFTGIAGYYNPFSAEVQYNTALPSSQIPFTIAHEVAHQIGYAREQEANFIACLLGLDASNEALEYSTNWYILKSLLRFQKNDNPKFVEKVFEAFSDGMKRDYFAEREFYEKNTGWMSDFFAFTNDVFLKSNQQEGSVTYDYFIELLILYEKEKVNK